MELLYFSEESKVTLQTNSVISAFEGRLSGIVSAASNTWSNVVGQLDMVLRALS